MSLPASLIFFSVSGSGAERPADHLDAGGQIEQGRARHLAAVVEPVLDDAALPGLRRVDAGEAQVLALQ